MNILSALRDKIGPEQIKLLSGFLGENEESLAKSTDLSITSMLQGLLRHIEQGPGITDIMNVIRDGGHSGDILDDLKGLFTNQDKTQLLVTIGNNINNHFFGSTSSAVSDKVAEFGGIKKTSAASLFSLCSPLVLGLIGKQVKSGNMNQTDLSNLLQDQKEIVQSQLPPAINTVYDQKYSSSQSKVVVEKETVEVVEKEEVVSKKVKSNSNTFGIFAWLLLAGLVLAAAYYSLRNRVATDRTSINSNTEMESIATDSSMVSQDESDAFDNIQTTPSSSENIDESSVDSKPIEATQSQKPSEPAFVAKPNPEVVRNEPAKATEPAKSSKSYGNVLDQLGSSNSWASFSASNFKGRTAELKSSNELNSLAEFLKINTNKSLQISGVGKSRSQEDRAYAVRGKLYELGVPLSQLQIIAGQTSSDGSVKMKIE